MVANKKTEGGSKTCKQLAIILQYLECPQYLRRILFPIHNFLKYTGVLNPLDAPHHFRQEDNVPFRLVFAIIYFVIKYFFNKVLPKFFVRLRSHSLVVV